MDRNPNWYKPQIKTQSYMVTKSSVLRLERRLEHWCWWIKRRKIWNCSKKPNHKHLCIPCLQRFIRKLLFKKQRLQKSRWSWTMVVRWEQQIVSWIASRYNWKETGSSWISNFLKVWTFLKVMWWSQPWILTQRRTNIFLKSKAWGSS